MPRRLVSTTLALTAPAWAWAFAAGGGSVPGLHGGGGTVAEAVAAEPLRPLPFFYDLYAFRGDTGTTDVVASFAVRAGRLDRENVDDEVRYRFNVALVLADTALGGVSRTDDSVFVAVPRPLGRDHLLHTHVETRARPSTTTVQRVLMFNAPQPGTGQLYTHAFAIPDFGGERLMLSDIALGLPGQGGGWRRGDVELALLPSSHFPGGAFDVYYEVYNLPEGRRYTTRMTFEPVGADGARVGGGEGTISVEFHNESAAGDDGTLAELRRVDVPLERRRYRLTVTVTDRERGRVAVRTRDLQVRPWSEGATLVATCPLVPTRERPACAADGDPARHP